MCDIHEEGPCSHEDSKSLSNGQKDEAGSDEINTLLSEEHGDGVISEDTNICLNNGQNDEVYSAETNSSLGQKDNGQKDKAGSDEINTLHSEEHGDRVITEATNRFNDEVYGVKPNASLVSNEQENDDVCTNTNTFVSKEQDDDDLYTETNTLLNSDQKDGEGVEETNILLDVKSTKCQTKPSKIGFCERLKKDKVFQHRIIHTFVIYWSFITMVSLYIIGTDKGQNILHMNIFQWP